MGAPNASPSSSGSLRVIDVRFGSDVLDTDGLPVWTDVAVILGGVEQIAQLGEPVPDVNAWMHEWIAKPHPDLGRDGEVCPFAALSLRRGGVHYAVVHGMLGVGTMMSVVARLAAEFGRLQEQSSHPNLETIVVMFPDIEVAALRDRVFLVQSKMKDAFVAEGRMLGEFAPGYTAGGIHNPNFPALSSPVPLLVIRAMVPNDAMFLNGSKDWLEAHAQRFAKVTLAKA